MNKEPIRHGYAIDIAMGAAYAKQQTVHTLYINATTSELSALIAQLTACCPSRTLRVYKTVSVPSFSKLNEVLIK